MFGLELRAVIREGVYVERERFGEGREEGGEEEERWQRTGGWMHVTAISSSLDLRHTVSLGRTDPSYRRAAWPGTSTYGQEVFELLRHQSSILHFTHIHSHDTVALQSRGGRHDGHVTTRTGI